ncbi:site-2 protease family protein [Candidatus Nomurabacteria bacterium]|uniref:Site-2 protease family protein n=1 Tax=candidate division WWE3 bacterium TaxID=2053526 RepID=A0A955E142_UNCKA|nr:site-2 protease family protein [candidate division WWE3 bacterium]MCB9823638.1 site-2 protease family protein [Candidatus Nomurabacteria bacterium]MCB9827284.1 site-2 protease family protein [Candidatus Nomurabacteria bacterium]MCB9827433.1 site-2 protease family protein [Candidatus Nomurabacteria bacterium]HXK52823.1 site-2 protease family protein [bacterium]
MISLLFSEPLVFALLFGVLVFSLTVHEYMHAAVADRLGDSTARLLGRVTLNPSAHLDPIGTLLLLVAGFGWGKPVPFNPINFKNPKRDIAIVAVAGPLSNFAMALVFGLILQLLPVALPQLILSVFTLLVYYNVALGVFNLLPINPLDGFKVVNGFLSHEMSIQWLQLAPYGIYILLFGFFTNTIEKLISPIISAITGFILRAPF